MTGAPSIPPRHDRGVFPRVAETHMELRMDVRAGEIPVGHQAAYEALVSGRLVVRDVTVCESATMRPTSRSCGDEVNERGSASRTTRGSASTRTSRRSATTHTTMRAASHLDRHGPVFMASSPVSAPRRLCCETRKTITSMAGRSRIPRGSESVKTGTTSTSAEVLLQHQPPPCRRRVIENVHACGSTACSASVGRASTQVTSERCLAR